MSFFLLDKGEGFGDSVEVTLPRNIAKEQLLLFAPFKNWISALRENLGLQYTDRNHVYHEDPYELSSIDVQSVDWFGRRIGFVKISAKIRNTRDTLPGVALLRGGYAALLILLRPLDNRHERYVIMTEQPRIPASSLRFREIPAGMLDGEGNFSGMAARELEEEMMLRIPAEEMIDLTELALRGSKVEDKMLRDAMYPSPGGSDEFITIFLWEKASCHGACSPYYSQLMTLNSFSTDRRLKTFGQDFPGIRQMAR
jgi:ADP-sugar diphosphatase